MKKILLTIAIVITLTVSASAQFKPFQFGLKIEPGITFPKLDSDDIYSGDTKMSFNWGFIGNFYFVENYGFSTGFNIRYINSEYSFDYSPHDSIKVNGYDRVIKNQYLEIPISLVMRTESINNLRIFGNIGYGLGFLLNGSKRDYDDFDNEVDILNDKYNKIRHALIIKLGVEYSVYKSSCLTAAIVYNNNFVNIYDKKAEHNVMLNNICLEIGFMF